MRRVLIVAPHFPPSNLASVHRSRLFAHHLPDFGWEPVVVTVAPEHYEEALDPNIEALVPAHVRIERVGALPTRPLRLVGDIGLRGFVPLLLRLLRIIDREGADFVYITIPSYYAAALGRIVRLLRGVPFGIDFIDPWVEYTTRQAKRWSKHGLSQAAAGALEPWSVHGASLITTVAAGYVEGMLERNPAVRREAIVVAMPYGGEAADQAAVAQLGIEPWLFRHEPGVFRLVYSGAMLFHAFEPLRRVFDAIRARPDLFADLRLTFIGTGTSPNDPTGYSVRPLAEAAGLWGTVVSEHPARIPYLDVLAHLKAADGAFILGSTEPHYTPSKVYQAALARTPIFAVLHEASTAVEIVRRTGTGHVLAFDGVAGLPAIEAGFSDAYMGFRHFATDFRPEHVDQLAFEEYSARSVTRTLADALDRALAAYGRTLG